jgi:hypothetical protein
LCEVRNKCHLDVKYKYKPQRDNEMPANDQAAQQSRARQVAQAMFEHVQRGGGPAAASANVVRATAQLSASHRAFAPLRDVAPRAALAAMKSEVERVSRLARSGIEALKGPVEERGGRRPLASLFEAIATLDHEMDQNEAAGAPRLVRPLIYAHAYTSVAMLEASVPELLKLPGGAWRAVPDDHPVLRGDVYLSRIRRLFLALRRSRVPALARFADGLELGKLKYIYSVKKPRFIQMPTPLFELLQDVEYAVATRLGREAAPAPAPPAPGLNVRTSMRALEPHDASISAAAKSARLYAESKQLTAVGQARVVRALAHVLPKSWQKTVRIAFDYTEAEKSRATKAAFHKIDLGAARRAVQRVTDKATS